MVAASCALQRTFARAACARVARFSATAKATAAAASHSGHKQHAHRPRPSLGNADFRSSSLLSWVSSTAHLARSCWLCGAHTCAERFRTCVCARVPLASAGRCGGLLLDATLLIGFVHDVTVNALSRRVPAGSNPGRSRAPRRAARQAYQCV